MVYDIDTLGIADAYNKMSYKRIDGFLVKITASTIRFLPPKPNHFLFFLDFLNHFLAGVLKYVQIMQLR